jgi:hypothetical protein
MTDEELDLLHGFLNGTLGQLDFARLQSLLRENAEARRTLRSLSTVEIKLHQLASGNPQTQPLLAPIEVQRSKPVLRWLSLRPLAAAAAGLVLGMFCTSVLFAYVIQAWDKSVTLLDTSFENITSRQAAGVPTRFGEWSGDFAEVVTAQNDVTPHSGEKMWRFLRADNVRGADGQASYVGEAMQAIDLKPLRASGEKAGSHIEISAWFAQGQEAPDARYHWNIKAAAFVGDVTEAPALWGKWDDTSASLAQRDAPAVEARKWQRLSLTMLLPPDADFLVFECAVVQRRPVVASGVAEFPLHYLDDVRVRLLPPTPKMLVAE